MIVNFICNQIVAHFYIAKTGHLRCCLYWGRAVLRRGCPVFCGEEKRGPGNPNIGHQNIKTLILVTLAKKIGIGQSWPQPGPSSSQKKKMSVRGSRLSFLNVKNDAGQPQHCPFFFLVVEAWLKAGDAFKKNANPSFFDLGQWPTWLGRAEVGQFFNGQKY